MNYKRAVKLKLFCTKRKKRQIQALIYAYRKAVNFYLRSFKIKKGKLNKDTLQRLTKTKLSERYKSNALKQALGIWKGCEKTMKKVPKFHGFPCLDSKFVTITEQPNKEFNIWIKLSTLAKGNKIYLPSKTHKRFDYWKEKGNLIQGCELRANYVIVWFKVIPKQEQEKTKNLSIDIGVNKLIVTNELKHIGNKFKDILNKIDRKQRNSKGYKRALKERDIFIDTCVKQIDFSSLQYFFIENLKWLKKAMQKRLKHWSYRKVITRVEEKCQENCVCLVEVNPKNTSRMCPVCGNVSKMNRSLEDFCCLVCGHNQDADEVGATNIFRKGMDSIRSQSPLIKSN